MNYSDSFRTSAIKPTQIAVIIYAIIKQIFVVVFVDGDNWTFRLIITLTWLAFVFFVTNNKKLSKRQLTMLVLTSTVIQEIIYYILSGGDRIIYSFLIGCSLLSIMYADRLAMLVTMFLSTISITFCVFVLDIKSAVGFQEDFLHDLFSVVGLVMINIVIYLIGKYTIISLAKSRQEAEEASKAKSNFLATMSHEIRTPMNAIIGVAQIDLQKDGLTKEYAATLQKIYNSGNNLLGIINDILDMSKIETGKMEINPVEYDITNLIHDTVQINMVRIGSKSIKFLLDIDEKLPLKLIGDELRIKQILNNLLSNAIKYTEKGYVKLSVSHTQKEDSIILRFIVEDTGQGMKSEDASKLFSEYMRFNIEMNRTTEGTGIGLNITKKLVELMEGKISVDSKYGKGSIFTVTVKQELVECEAIGFELAQQLSNFIFKGEKRIADLQIIHKPMPHGKVLVVDDVEANLYVAEGLLSPYGMQIETATSGYAAIERVESGKVYDIIFMDHMMPYMDGIETTHKLRSMDYKGTIVALTANALTGNDKMFKQSGFDDFISKPIDLKQLDAILNRHVRDKNNDNKEASKKDEQKSTLLEIFIKDAEKAVIALKQTAACKDERELKLFTTTVHAMKSALSIVGEEERSKAASLLEEAGLKSDREYITANAEHFILSLQALINNINSKETVSGEMESTEEDIPYLREQLGLIKAACEKYDDAAVYASLALLEGKKWKKHTSEQLKTMRDTLYLHSDFDAIVKLTNKLMEHVE